MNEMNEMNKNIAGHKRAQKLEIGDSLAFSAFTATFSHVKWNYQSTSGKSEFETIDEQLTGITNSMYMTYDIELKMRNYARKPADCIIEVNKKLALDSYSENERKIYMVFYPYLNKVYVWNLNVFTQDELDAIYDPNFWCRSKTTYGFEEGNKEVYKLPIKRAKNFDFISFVFFKEQLKILDEMEKIKYGK